MVGHSILPACQTAVILCLLGLPVWAADPQSAARTGGPAQARIDYSRHIRPILADKCFRCHGPDAGQRRSGLRLDVRDGALQPADSGERAIVPGKPADSVLVQRIFSSAEDFRMPPSSSNKPLTAAEKVLLKTWIEQGASYTTHWSFTKPVRPVFPPVRDWGWVKNEIDAFILSRLELAGLRPSPEAERVTLIRRLTLDLTGLPPTIPEVEDFLKDRSPEAYEKVVDRLLASPHYGEKMAQDWLDLARFGDTNGYQTDNYRSVWPYRDYVIAAFNANKPFDQFTLENLAGDLLPNATQQHKIASGFHRNHRHNGEGGSDPEEFLVAYAVDRTNTTATVWLGLTLGCAQCHDHKYDPFSQREYYQLYAFFNSLKGEVGVSKTTSGPVLKLPTAAQKAELERVQRQLKVVEERIKEREPQVVAALAAWEKQQAAGTVPASSTPNGLLAHYELERSSDRHIADRSGQGHHGTYLNGEPAWVPGILGQAVKFRGELAMIDVGRIADFEWTQPFSYGCWFNADRLTGTLVAKLDDVNARRGYDVGLTESGQLVAHLIHRWPLNGIRVVTRKQIQANTWHHVLVTYDGSGKAAGVSLYLDGQRQPVEIQNDTLSQTIRSEVPLFLGRSSDSEAFYGAIDEVRIYDRLLSAEEATRLYDAVIQQVLATPEQRTPEQKQLLRRHYLDRYDAEHSQLEGQQIRLRNELKELEKAVASTLVMEEPDKPRPAHLLKRGDFQHKGDPVGPDVPALFTPLSKDKPRNRLTLAQWLVDPDNPLTARVTVNRLWKQFFGEGLVRTLDDFGLQGEFPSHPELLDWLASQLIADQWNLKAFQKRMVMSATYRQASAVPARSVESDPYNRLLWRGARFRLSAEEIRDSALAISGLLARRVGGPSVNPYQPEGYFGDKSEDWKWQMSQGSDLYRRGLYTYWRRTTPYPSFQAFDAPTREVCTVNRPRTNTPLQALVTLNDPVFVEAARVFGQRILREGGDRIEDKLAFAFRCAVARQPSERERAVLERTYRRQLQRYQADRQAALTLVSNGPAPRPLELDVAELAAWTAVGNLLLNLDETITRE